MLEPKLALILAVCLFIAALALGAFAIAMALFAVFALLSSPESGGGLSPAFAFLLFSLIAGVLCGLAGVGGMALLRQR